jgi:t-SNARE complex subunit (syntaxin)
MNDPRIGWNHKQAADWRNQQEHINRVIESAYAREERRKRLSNLLFVICLLIIAFAVLAAA